jgi:hypothetical protein
MRLTTSSSQQSGFQVPEMPRQIHVEVSLLKADSINPLAADAECVEIAVAELGRITTLNQLAQ